MMEKYKLAHDDFLNRYSILIDDIKYIKTRQWVVTYYLLLLFVALIGFSRLMKFDNVGVVCCQKIILSGIAFLVAVLGTFYQHDFQKRLSRYRKQLIEILEYLSTPYREYEKKVLKKRFKNVDKYFSYCNGFCKFTLPFIIILWLGVFFIFWYLFFNA